MGGGGAPVPWGRRHWVGIHFCRHPEVVKLQQQCHMQNTIFDLPHNWFYSFFFSGRGRVPIYPGDSNRRIGRKNENDNPVRKWYICSSIITLIFGFFMTFRGSDMCHLEKLEQPAKRLFLLLLFPREIQGIKWKNGNFLI